MRFGCRINDVYYFLDLVAFGSWPFLHFQLIALITDVRPGSPLRACRVNSLPTNGESLLLRRGSRLSGDGLGSWTAPTDRRCLRQKINGGLSGASAGVCRANQKGRQLYE
jgi:hypothetical protein